MNENIRVLFEMGKIEEPNEELARNFCRASKIGTYKCAVTTRFGFSCDLCLEEELLYTYSRVLLWAWELRACLNSKRWGDQQGGHAEYGL